MAVGTTMQGAPRALARTIDDADAGILGADNGILSHGDVEDRRRCIALDHAHRRLLQPFFPSLIEERRFEAQCAPLVRPVHVDSSPAHDVSLLRAPERQQAEFFAA